MGGTRYYFEVAGKMGGFARYIKITDAEEKTISFVQEIYDSTGKMTSIHEKYPVDKGHQKLVLYQFELTFAKMSGSVFMY